MKEIGGFDFVRKPPISCYLSNHFFNKIVFSLLITMLSSRQPFNFIINLELKKRFTLIPQHYYKYNFLST